MDQKTQKALFSSKSDEWATPQNLFDHLNKLYNFNLDPCATKENAKCKDFYTKEDNGLDQDWGSKNVFINPPYSNVGKWVEKAYKESLKENTIIVLLIPARTDTKWFHEYVMKSTYIRFIKGRLKFGDSKNSAPFPSMVVVFDSRTKSINHAPYISSLAKPKDPIYISI